MQKLRVQCFGISIDGYSAGPNQDMEHPLGAGGETLMEWFFPTQVFQEMVGDGKGETGIDNDFALRGFENVGAWILGRNMFGPIRGPWPNDDWKGWWGETPPYHCDVFVLTHHARAPIPMAGGTTFHFVTEGPEKALQLAFDSAKGKDVRIGGGAATVRQYLQLGLIDEMHLAQSPTLLGSGESPFSGLNLKELGYECIERTPTAKATHVVLARSK
jgi:dihydrofolate reductase